MPKGYARTDRVADLVQTTLADIIQHEDIAKSFGLVTIVDVKVSPDFSHARVYVSVLPEENAKQAVDELNQFTKELRYLLAQAVKLRVTPNLKFFYDDSSVRGTHISSLIDNALKKIKNEK